MIRFPDAARSYQPLPHNEYPCIALHDLEDPLCIPPEGDLELPGSHYVPLPADRALGVCRPNHPVDKCPIRPEFDPCPAAGPRKRVLRWTVHQNSASVFLRGVSPHPKDIVWQPVHALSLVPGFFPPLEIGYHPTHELIGGHRRAPCRAVPPFVVQGLVGSQDKHIQPVCAPGNCLRRVCADTTHVLPAGN
jgi:hypothetical protein